MQGQRFSGSWPCAFCRVADFNYPQIIDGKPVPPQTGSEPSPSGRVVAGPDDPRWGDWADAFHNLVLVLDTMKLGHYRADLASLPPEKITAFYYWHEFTVENAATAVKYALELLEIASQADREHLQLALGGGVKLIGESFWLIKLACIGLLKEKVLTPLVEALFDDNELDSSGSLELVRDIIAIMPWFRDKAREQQSLTERAHGNDAIAQDSSEAVAKTVAIASATSPAQALAMHPSLHLDQDNQIGSQVCTIWSHGNRSYSRDGISPYVVTQEEDWILQAFLKEKSAMNTKTLVSKSGVSNVSRVVNGLAIGYDKLFADAIRKPLKKGSGYFILVSDAPE